jgi:hypothetical protein
MKVLYCYLKIRRDLYLATHNRQSSMLSVYFFFFVRCASVFWYWTFNCRLYRIVLHAVDFSSRKIPTASVGSEPAILGIRGQHANP